MKARALVLLVAVLAALAVSMPSSVASPRAGCPPAFIGPLTFAELSERWPPPPDLPDPEAVLESFDKNGDKLLCVLELVPQNPISPINVIDNNAAT